jgi:hypothetical protein
MNFSREWIYVPRIRNVKKVCKLNSFIHGYASIFELFSQQTSVKRIPIFKEGYAEEWAIERRI